MVKIVTKTISLPTKLVKELYEFNRSNKNRPVNISKVCQEALWNELEKAKKEVQVV